jgi:3-oxoacyl-[acyl-carrier protein] reductase
LIPGPCRASWCADRRLSGRPDIMARLTKLSRSIAGSVAVITGAASGMGRATAHLFADEGARLALIDINAGALQAVVEEVQSVGADVLPLTVDLSDRQAVGSAIVNIGAHFGAIDILVNNAGFAMLAEIDSDDYPDSWDTSLAVMATAQAWAIRAALPYLRKSQHPRIVNVASTEAHGATRFNSAYVVAKHASLGLTRAMAVDLGKEGITVNCVCPGPVRTGITDAIPEEAKQTFANRRTALRRYAEPEEVAHATLSLVLPAASFITGATLIVDGGVTIRNA